MVRSIRFYGTDHDIGIELNGDRAFYHRESPENAKVQIPYEEGLALLEDFYALPRINEYRGKKSDDRQTSTHHLITIYDEKPEHYSKEWVDYLIPKDSAEGFPEFESWMKRISHTAD